VHLLLASAKQHAISFRSIWLFVWLITGIRNVKNLSRIGVVSLLVAAVALSGCARFGGSTKKGRSTAGQETAIGVNGFLWRASLETLSFMPLESADPYGGVIITGWHSDAAAPHERFKATVYILDSRLRADGLKVAVFKQIQDSTGQWLSGSVDPDTEIQIENSILSRARELKIRTLR